MFQNGQRVCFKNGGDPARIQKVQLAYGKDRSRAPQVIPTTDTNATQVQIVTGEDAARYPFIDPIGLYGAPAAWYRADSGVTVTGQGVSTLADQSGNGRDLLQGTDASRPPYLGYSGTKYLYLPGVAGNYASTPDSVANSITGDIDIRVRVALDDWTPSAAQTLVGKDPGSPSTNRSYLFYVNTDGTLHFLWTFDGSDAGSLDKASTVATGLTDKSAYWVRVTLDVNNGAAGNDVKFYTAADSATEPTSWTQLGTTVTTGGTTSIFDGTYGLEVGSRTAGATLPAAGKLYRAIIKNGIDGTTVVDFNPNLDGSDQAATITSSATGEVWTINTSGGLPAQIVGRPSLLFDGTADYLKTNAFTLNQPETVYIAFKQVSWTNGDNLIDGNAANSLVLQQNTSSPNLGAYAGDFTSLDGNLAVGAYGVVCVVFNGASSLIRVNNNANTTGNCGASNAGGFTLGAGATPSNYGNAQFLEAIVFSTAHDATQRARVIQYLAGRHGIAL